MINKLKEFSGYKVDENVSNFVYFDNKNPVLIKNIENTNIYGLSDILKTCSTKISSKELQDWKKIQENVDTPEFKQHMKNLVSDDCEFEDLKFYFDYHQQKHRIELYNIKEYADIINDLYSPLVSWMYTRERDNMYFLLGFYYMRNGYLHSKNTLSNKGNNIDNDIYRNIVNIYMFGKKVYKKGGSSGAKKRKFMEENKDQYLFAENRLLNRISDDRLKTLFVSSTHNSNSSFINHETILQIRNSIDHFNYFNSNRKCSLLDYYYAMYNVMYYDKKVQRSVLPKFISILERYNVELSLSIIDKNESEFLKIQKIKSKPVNIPDNVQKKIKEQIKKAEETGKTDIDKTKMRLYHKNNNTIEEIEKILKYK